MKPKETYNRCEFCDKLLRQSIRVKLGAKPE